MCGKLTRTVLLKIHLQRQNTDHFQKMSRLTGFNTVV
ncbi:MAG: hypothetical protein ACI935_002410, partial [Moritella dasanensis]